MYNLSQTKSMTKVSIHFVYAVIVALACLLSLQMSTRADDLMSPNVPATIQVPAGNKLFLVGHATGTQNYICLPADGGVKFVLFTPQATLFKEQKQIITHYFSPNPAEGDTVRATWEHSKDSSKVWGMVATGNSSADPAYVDSNAIPWLLVTVVGTESGSGDGDALAKTTFIQRVHTNGGVAPATGCTSTSDIGARAYVPYIADYYFYKKGK